MNRRRDPGPDFQHAAATFNCGPADGPATAILLARDPIQSLPPSYPFVSVYIWHPVDSLAGKVYRVGDNSGDATAVYVTGPGKNVGATDGTVRIERVAGDKTVTGSVELRFPPRVVADGFSAPWIESFVLCG